MSLEIPITPELEAYMRERRDFYKTNYPAMTKEERMDLVMEDMVKEHFRLQGEEVLVAVERVADED